MSKLWTIMGFYTNVEPHITLPVLILGPEFDEEFYDWCINEYEITVGGGYYRGAGV